MPEKHIISFTRMHCNPSLPLQHDKSTIIRTQNDSHGAEGTNYASQTLLTNQNKCIITAPEIPLHYNDKSPVPA